MQVRSIVLPKVLAEVGYAISQDSLIEANENNNGGPLINNQTWSSDVRVVQSIFEGGRLLSALRQDKLIREQATRTNIHCLHFGRGKLDKPSRFLTRLAAENRGSYTYIDMRAR